MLLRSNDTTTWQWPAFQATRQNLSATNAKQDPLSLRILEKEQILLNDLFWPYLAQVRLEFCLGTEKQALEVQK